MEATAKYYKQWGAKSELIQVPLTEGCAWLNGAQMATWGRIPGVTVWSKDPMGPKKDEWHQCVNCFQG